MDFNLLSQNLLIFLCIAVTLVLTIVAAFVNKSWRDLRFFNIKPAGVLTGAALLAVAFQLIISYFYPNEDLPALWVMALPFTIALGFLVPAWTSKKNWLRAMSVAGVLCGLALSAAIINNYYNFYPTFYSLFTTDTKALLKQQNANTPKGQAGNDSVEGSLYATASAGKIEAVTIPGKVSKFKPRQEWVYVPPIAVSQPKIKLPVIVLIPGSPGEPYNWLTANLKQTMDSFSKAHHGITPYVFVADDTGSLTNDTECANSPRGNIETYLTTDVPNYIKQHYSVETSPQNWAIGGLSMGGTCSIVLTLRHPDVYRNFLDFGGEIGPEIGSQSRTTDILYGGSVENWQEHQPLWLLANRQYKSLKIGGWFEIGGKDETALISANQTLNQKSRAAGIDSIFKETKGSHTFSAEGQSFRDALPWISNRLGATNL